VRQGTTLCLSHACLDACHCQLPLPALLPTPRIWFFRARWGHLLCKYAGLLCLSSVQMYIPTAVCHADVEFTREVMDVYPQFVPFNAPQCVLAGGKTFSHVDVLRTTSQHTRLDIHTHHIHTVHPHLWMSHYQAHVSFVGPSTGAVLTPKIAGNGAPLFSYQVLYCS
jgi:hypothetical protein